MSDNEKIKLLIVGDGAVGKTCALISYATDEFPTVYVPTVFENHAMDIDVNGKKINLELWDTAGQEAYSNIRTLSYPDAHVFLIAYSTVDRTSLANTEQVWYKEIKDHWQGEGKIPIILVGMKIDLIPETDPSNVVTMEEAQAVATRLNAGGCYQCSAKTQEGLKEVFDAAINLVLKERFENAKPSGGCCSIF